MKTPLLLSMLLCSFFHLNAQICPPFPGGGSAGDESPGCYLLAPVLEENTGNFTKKFMEDDNFPCGTIENNLFFSFSADSTTQFDGSVFIPVNNCQNDKGIEIVFYDLNFNPVSSCITINPAISQTDFLVENLIPGDIYWVMVDGIDGDFCEFLFLRNFSTTITTIITPPIVTSSRGGKAVCPGSEVCFSAFDIVERDVIGFRWSAPQNANVTKGGEDKDDFICMTFPEVGFGAGKVALMFEDTTFSEFIGFFINVGDVIYEDTVLICPGEIYEINGSNFDAPGNYPVVFEEVNSFGCDSTLNLEVKMPDTAALEITCFIDTFLNALTIDWEGKPLADFYEISINGSVVASQDFFGYIVNRNITTENIEVKIQPVGNHGCLYNPGIITCQNPVFTNLQSYSIEKSVSVFPNPSQNSFEISSRNQVEKIEVFDFSSKKVKEVFDTKIDLSKFESGIYFLKIHIKNNVVLKKVMKF